MNRPPDKLSQAKDELEFPSLNLRALGLAPLSSREFYIFSGNKTCTLSESALPKLAIDGSRFVQIRDGRGNHLEVHWGPRDDLRYLLYPGSGNSASGESLKLEGDGRIYGDKHLRGKNGELEIVYHNICGAADSEKARRLNFSTEAGKTIISSPGASRPSDAFRLCLRNGKIEWAQTKDYSGEKDLKPGFSAEPSVCAARAALLSRIAGRNTDTWTWAKWQCNLMRLETDSLSRIESNYKLAGMDKLKSHRYAVDEIVQVYNQLGRLLENRTIFRRQNPDAEDRLAVACAEQVLDHAANPGEINQGAHPTCTAACLENRIYSRYPSRAARLVVDLALTGSYRSSMSGLVVSVDPDSLQAHSDAKAYVPQDRDRGIASQIFELGALNLLLTRKKTGLSYRQAEAGAEGDSGDRLIDAAGKTLDDCPRADHNDLLFAAAEISGKNDPVWIAHARNFREQASVAISDAGELKAFLDNSSAKGNLPVGIHVYSDQEPLYTESGGRRLKVPGTPHLLALRGSVRGLIEVDNQWGSCRDHFGSRAMKSQAVFEMMRDPFWLRTFRSLGWQK